MTHYEARQKAEADYKQAVLELKQDNSQRNRDRLKIKKALLDGLNELYRRGAS
jgi:hypothetical protein